VNAGSFQPIHQGLNNAGNVNQPQILPPNTSGATLSKLKNLQELKALTQSHGLGPLSTNSADGNGKQLNLGMNRPMGGARFIERKNIAAVS
jgi:hypothetical protein